MSSADHFTSSATATGRKAWETPTITVQSTRHDTHAAINNPGTDGVASTGSSYGS